MTTLFEAAAAGDIPTCKALIDAGANVDTLNGIEATPLMYAAEAGKTETCVFLIQNGAKVNAQGDFVNLDALNNAFKNNHYETCFEFIKNNADIKFLNLTNQGKLFLKAAQANQKEICDVFIASGLNIDSLLYEFAKNGDTENCLAFAKIGGNLNKALFTAAKEGDLKTCQTIISLGADINAFDEQNQSALSIALVNNNWDICFVLLKHNPDLKQLTQEMKNELLLRVAFTGEEDLCHKLILAGADVNAKDKSGTTLLAMAAFSRNLNLVQYLLKNDAVKNQAVPLGSIIYSSPEIVKLLFSQSVIEGIAINRILKPNAINEILKDNFDLYLNELKRNIDNPKLFFRQLNTEWIAQSELLIAWDILDANNKVKAFEHSYKSNSETAMSPREMSAAKTAYDTAQALYNDEFQQWREKSDGDEHKAIENIEVDLRNMLLDKLHEEGSLEIKQFIDQNRQALCQGQDSETMEKARKLFNANDNPLHITWRAYDKDAPTTGWINLFTTPTVNTHQYGAGDRSTEDISWDIRKRVAFYFLALKDGTYATDDQATREAFFIGELAEIRRAHNESDTVGQDNPSCYPGTIGRIGKMGRGHSKLAVINPIEQIPIFIQNLLSKKLHEFIKDNDNTTQERLFHALSAFTSETIKDAISGKNILEAFDISPDELNEIAKLHQEVLNLITPDEVYTQLNEYFKNCDPPIRPLVDQEKIYIERQLKDINYIYAKGVLAVGLTLAQQFRPEEKLSNPYTDEYILRLNDYLLPFRNLKSEKGLNFDLMNAAKFYLANKDKGGKIPGLNEDHVKLLNDCANNIRLGLTEKQNKLDKKRQTWEELYQALKSVQIENKSEVLKKIVDKHIDDGKDINALLKKYNIEIPKEYQAPEKQSQGSTQNINRAAAVLMTGIKKTEEPALATSPTPSETAKPTHSKPPSK